MELTLDQALQKGVEAHKAGKVKEADQYYTAILQAQPKHPDANHNMGVLAVGVGKVEQALPFFKTALEANSSIEQFWLSYIDALIKLEQLADAKAVLDQAKSTGVKGDAFDQLEKKLNEEGDDIPFNKRETLLTLYKHRKFKEALYEVSLLLDRFSMSSFLHNIHGGILNELGQFDEAILEFRKAIVIKPDYAPALQNMGSAFKGQGNLQEAIKAYKEALELNPDLFQTMIMLGKCYKELGLISESSHYFELASNRDPEDISGVSLELAALGLKAIPTKTPANFMKEFYRIRANTWDTAERFSGHDLIKDAFTQTFKSASQLKILDLGCGTGSLASFLRPYAETLDGLDSSSDMIKIAKKRDLYDTLKEDDMETHFENNSTEYDCIIAAAVFIHFFDLQDILSTLKDRLVKQGKIIFSVFETTNTEKEVNDFLMYAHSQQYIHDLAETLGFKITYEKKSVHEYNGSDPIMALIYVFES